ncbi:4-coumarate--CoA ligase-like 7 [Carex littledalei]|uniref:4-coumarate--CoA ligase n=1 Tax=Carex littledalei TaxID=544730 RepID=A0A833VAH8_9POAL|nr:4-coumarate--CoA ligase-like 7 [Carex littledalei]
MCFSIMTFSDGYGSTEGGGISRMIGQEECSRLKSAGRLAENVQVKIVDPNTGNALSVGQAGELWIKSPACMTGYIGDDEANAAAFDSDGWLKTGDLCYIDQDGFVYVVDRLKELIKYKAYQVPPAELEHVLHSHPEVADAAVIPYVIPNEEVGQIPAALVVRRDGSTLCESEVIDYVAKQVAPYKKIRKVLFVNKIPKSPAGKILRRELSNHILWSSFSRL